MRLLGGIGVEGEIELGRCGLSNDRLRFGPERPADNGNLEIGRNRSTKP